MYRVKVEGQSGMFPMKDFHVLTKKELAKLKMGDTQEIEQMSPIHPLEGGNPNWFKEMPDKALYQRMGQMTKH